MGNGSWQQWRYNYRNIGRLGQGNMYLFTQVKFRQNKQLLFWIRRKNLPKYPSHKRLNKENLRKKRKWESDMLPRLNHRFWSGGFLFNGSTEPSIHRLPSRVPRLFLPGYGHFITLSGYGHISFFASSYAVSILRASSLMLIAAFLSLSITLPQLQR